MANQDAFLADILANPLDDGLRLIYADWLDERNDPRGEFIRLQIEWTNLDADSPKCKDVQERMRELFHANVREWTKGLENLPAILEFRRGFADYAEMGIDEFLDRGENLFQQAPITFLNLHTGRSSEVQKAVQSPLLKQIRFLRFWNVSTSFKVGTALAQSEHLHSLELLDFNTRDTFLRPKGAQALAESDNLPALKTLVLTHNKIQSAGFQSLARSPSLKLEHLDLCGNKLKAEDMDYFEDSDSLAHLHTLGLWYNQLGNAGVERLVKETKGTKLPKLKRLNLNNNAITTRGIEALTDSPLLSQLSELYLCFNSRIGKRDMHLLAEQLEANGKLFVGLHEIGKVSGTIRAEMKERFGDRVDFESRITWNEDTSSSFGLNIDETEATIPDEE